MMNRILSSAILLISMAFGVFAQTETLTNAQIIEMSKVGLEKRIILDKINGSKADFDISAEALVELKKAGVENEIIALMLEKAKSLENPDDPKNYSESRPATEILQFNQTVVDPKEALLSAKSVAIEKSSLNPARQALEKALFKRKEWAKYDLTIIRYKDQADLFIEIGRIPFSWITHRYVFRIYDRKSGTIITAGETTSWGSLAENLAREITQKIDAVSGK